MKKMIMAAAAACAFAFSGMAMAAELPAGWQLVQQDGENVSTCAVELRLRRQYSSHADTCLPLGSKIDPLI